MTLSVTHNKTLTNPSTGTQDKVYGADYVAANSHTLSGTADVNQGGTGAATLTAHGVLVGNGTGAVHVTGVGAAGQVLTSNGAGQNPTYQNAAAGDVVGPASSGDGNVALFDGVTGKLLQDGGTPEDLVMNAGYWSCVGNGDLADPQIVFDGDGAPVVMWVSL